MPRLRPLDGICREVGEKAKPSQVDAQQGYSGTGQGAGGAEEGAVASHCDGKIAVLTHVRRRQGQIAGLAR